MSTPLKQGENEGFDSITIAVASPETILGWSHGEVKKPETINYRTQKPERDGLFCEKIFGPTKNWECYCGKYKRIRYKGVVCEKCGVEVTRSSVRRERMGHIKLAVPVTHIWFLRSTPSRIGLLLDLPIKSLEQVVYFAAYVVTHMDEKAKEEAKTQLATEYKTHRKKLQDEAKEMVGERVKGLEGEKKTKLQGEIEKEYAQKMEELDEKHSTAKDDLNGIRIGKVYYELEYRDMSVKFGHVFKASTGAESIRDIIQGLDLEKLMTSLEAELKKCSGQKQKKIMKRVKLIGNLIKNKIRPEWTIMTVLPVIPPDLRPMVQLDGGRFAASDLNDLYRRVINRNNRLKRLLAIGAPEVICRNEKRMLQEAVDTLLNNNVRAGRTVFNSGDKRKLRSLSDMLKGKQGRFRQNLLGKRVDYSGRSVIVVGPKLKLHQCGLPKSMALELFRPFVIGRLIRDDHAHNIKNAEKLIQAGRKEVWDILEEVTKNHYVLLNRAPTLHRLGIQAFQPILIEGKAIQIHPLVCSAFNADFDGDQMAVHVPLSRQAQLEAKELILSSQNLLKPSDGHPIVTPIQDMVLGCYYLTKINPNKKGEGMAFSSLEEAMIAYQSGEVHIQASVKGRFKGKIYDTTVGRMIFNNSLPEEYDYVNETVDKKRLTDIVSDVFEKCGMQMTAIVVDNLKRIGFQFATKSGLSIGASDMVIPKEKEAIVENANELVKEINEQYATGLTTDDERYIHTIKVWGQAKSEISTAMIKSIKDDNHMHYMINSGARGNWGQVTQLCGMKGLVANPAGKTIELPIKSNLKEGFTILEYFIATHGGRKGKSDTALKTAEAGYLTRRLVDAVQDVVIREYDCGTKEVHLVTREESEKIGELFENRIYGRVFAKDLIDPKTGEILAQIDQEIDKKLLKKIKSGNIMEVQVRSIMTCQTDGGVCVKCYGKDLGTNETVKIGTAVGIIAAQSIGEPGTQLTMRTFHMGGVAEGSDITHGLTRVEELFEARNPKNPAILSEIDGFVSIEQKGQQAEISVSSAGPVEKKFMIPGEMSITVKTGDTVKEGNAIAKNDESKAVLRSDITGTVTSANEGEVVIKTDTAITKIYKVPSGRSLKVRDGTEVKKGQALTTGHLNLRELMDLAGIYPVEKYVMTEVQTIYASQGQTINDKHIEIIARQMLSRVRVVDSGDSDYLPGEIISMITYEKLMRDLEKAGKKNIRGERLLLGLTRISLYTDSWLSAASFQETIRVLVEASTTKRIDVLEGLKENVIIGKLIPAGGTFRRRNKAMVEAMEGKLQEEVKKGIRLPPKDEAKQALSLDVFSKNSDLYPVT